MIAARHPKNAINVKFLSIKEFQRLQDSQKMFLRPYLSKAFMKVKEFSINPVD